MSGERTVKKVMFMLILLSCMLPAEVPAGTVREPGPKNAAGEKKNAKGEAGKKTSSGKQKSNKGKAAKKKPAAAKQAAQGKKAGKKPGAMAAAPALVAPANGSTLEHGVVGFTWTRSSEKPAYEVQVANDPGFTSPVISAVSKTASYVAKTELASGTYYWRVKETNARRQVKTWSPVWTFIVPVPAPLNTTADHFINNGIVSTNSATVSLALSAKSGNGIAAYAIAETIAEPETGEPRWAAVTPAKQYASVVPYTLSSGEGMKVLSVWFKDTAGKVSAKKSAAITFDATPPDTTITSHPDAAANSTAASFRFASSKPAAKFRCSLDEGAYEVCSSPALYTGLVKGGHKFAVRATDATGNSDPTPAQHAWTVHLPVRNTTPQRFINRGASLTARDTVRLSLSASSTLQENVTGYYVSEDPDIPAASDPGWVHFKEVKAFSRDVEYTMSEGAGSKVLYVWFKDSEGNVSDVQSDTIYRLDPKYVVILLLLVQAVIIL